MLFLKVNSQTHFNGKSQDYTVKCLQPLICAVINFYSNIKRLLEPKNCKHRITVKSCVTHAHSFT